MNVFTMFSVHVRLHESSHHSYICMCMSSFIHNDSKIARCSKDTDLGQSEYSWLVTPLGGGLYRHVLDSPLDVVVSFLK